MHPHGGQAESSALVVLHAGAIGDFILTLSVVQPLRSCLNTGPVAAVAGAASARVAAGRSVINAHLWPEQVGLHTLFAEDIDVDERLVRLLHGARCVLSFLGGAAGPTHERLCAAAGGEAVSVDPRASEQTLAAGVHITRQWCTAIREAGLAIGEPTPAVIRLKSGRDASGDARRRIVVHPGSGGRCKCWPIERFVAVVESLGNAAVTWVLGPAECVRDGGVPALVQARIATGDRLVVEQDLFAVAGRIAGADLYLGNDAGPTHLAAAMGVPTVAVFGATDPRVWRPLGGHVAIVAPTGGYGSIEDVSVQQVCEAASSLRHRTRE